MKSIKFLLIIILSICIQTDFFYMHPVVRADSLTENETADYPWHITDTGCPSLWAALENSGRKPGQDVVVAVIDTGLDTECEAFQDALWINEVERNGEKNVDDDGNGYIDDINGLNLTDSNSMTDTDGHGTEMAGIIAGRPVNPSYDFDPLFCGIAYGAKIMPIKVSSDTNFPTAKMVEAISYAVNMGADIINLSCVTFQNIRELKSSLQAASQSCVIVASAGNQGIDAANGSQGLPAAWNFVIGVMSYDMEHTISSFSNFDSSDNPCYDLAAPGTQIWEMTQSGTLKYGKGTSQSAAIVSGGVAILKSLTKDQYSAPELKELFLKYIMANEDAKISYRSGDTTLYFPQFSLKKIEEDLENLCGITPSPSTAPEPSPSSDAATTEAPTKSPLPDVAATPTVTTEPSDTAANVTPSAAPASSISAPSSNMKQTSSSAPSASAAAKQFQKGVLKYKITKDGTLTVTGYAKPGKQAKKHLIIPNKITYKNKTYNVTKIKSSAFMNNPYIRKITLGKNIKTIGRNAFKKCKHLKKIILKKKGCQLNKKRLLKRLKKGKKVSL